ncbi:MAG: aminopeptidase [Desulfuromonadales bacterium]
MRRLSSPAVFLLCVLLLSACSESDYLLQCARGQWSLMSRARPIDAILAEKTEPQNVREQLAKVVRLREFAVSALDLPDTGSYRNYSDLERPYAVWNLVVAPEFSLKLKQWCFPIAGCVTYRGYFEEASARALADDFSARGFDVDVYGVQAYSTLNWFDDPVLNTFLNNDDMRLAALLFHEMAHQVVYVQNDTAFNESFAKTVEREGLRRWLQDSGSHDLWQQYLQRESRTAEFHQLLADVRTRLGQTYASRLENDLKRSAKKTILQQAFVDYEELKKSWDGYAGYDPWMKRGLNNARLSAMATYYDLVPAFQTLLAQGDADLQKFYAEVKDLGALAKDQRLAKLKALSPDPEVSLHE